jgi:hypothetical protein
MADAHGSGPCVRKDVRVQLPPRPPGTHVRGTRSPGGGHRCWSGGPSPPDPQPGASPPDPHPLGTLRVGLPFDPCLGSCGPAVRSPPRFVWGCGSFSPRFERTCCSAVSWSRPLPWFATGLRFVPVLILACLWARPLSLGVVSVFGSSVPSVRVRLELLVIRSWAGVLVQPTTVGSRRAVGETRPQPVGWHPNGGLLTHPASADATLVRWRYPSTRSARGVGLREPKRGV